MRSKFKRVLAVLASAAVMGNSLIASMPLAAYEADAGGIVGDDTSVDIGNTSQGTELVEGIAVNDTNFPDETFRTYVSDSFDKDDDNVLSAEEIAAVTLINVSNMDIGDLTGVEYFTALTVLVCYGNQLTSLDVSGCTALETLSCYRNKLTNLDVSGCTALTNLECYDNDLKSLDVSNNAALTDLHCDQNRLTSLDVSNNAALTDLDCDNNQLTSLDVSKNTALDSFYCYANPLLALNGMGDIRSWYAMPEMAEIPAASISLADYGIVEEQVSNLTGGTIADGELTPDEGSVKVSYTYDCGNGNTIDCSVQFGISVNDTNFPDETFRNHVSENFDDGDAVLTAEEIAAVTEINVPNMGIADLTGVKYFTALTRLDCHRNFLGCLDVSGCTTLEHLNCAYNDLTTLDVSGCTALTWLDCYYNTLPSLDVSTNSALTSLDCSYNALTTLDVSDCRALTYLNCYSNQLTGLDVSSCTALTNFYCQLNQLTTLDVSQNTNLESMSCNENPILSINGVNTEIGLFEVEPLKAFITTGSSVKLSDHGISEAKVSNLTGGEIVDDAIVPTAIPGTVTYMYDADGGNTISCTIEFVVPVDAEHFPDAAFRDYVDTIADTTDDDFLTAEEIAKVKKIRPVYCEISDMTGIEYFTALTELDCACNELTNLDVSRNEALQVLACDGNRLTSLDVSKNTALTELQCSNNLLTSLDVSNNTELTILQCFNNLLTSLDVSNNTKLTFLSCADNQLTSMDVSKNTELTDLYCNRNQLTSLDMSNNTKLTALLCDNNQLTSLDLTKNPQLVYLYCDDNPFLAVNAVTGITGHFDASPLTAFTAKPPPHPPCGLWHSCG